jgi:4-hydroxy-tetrahydrodipicolinate reductase
MNKTLQKPKMKVMVNGLPGKMATELAKKLIESERFDVRPYSLTGSEINNDVCYVSDQEFRLIMPKDREIIMSAFKPEPEISVDFTHPSAVNKNAEFYCSHGLHFVMGTTGGDRPALEKRVLESNIVAVIAQNMAKQIVAFQAMMKFAAENFPNVFRGYELEIVESHQKAKADPSGTAKSLIEHFNALGVPFTANQIKMVREPQQQLAMGVPEAALNGHGWHTYTLKSPDNSVLVSFTHNVNGREVYLAGTIDAIDYLSRKIAQGEKGNVYTMMDVLKGK